MKRLAIYAPWECDCKWGKVPTVYKRIAEINSYFVECDHCKTRSGYYECLEDAVDAWDVGDRESKGQDEN